MFLNLSMIISVAAQSVSKKINKELKLDKDLFKINYTTESDSRHQVDFVSINLTFNKLFRQALIV